eukprot:3658-Heterococcus_DN1.PRE.2
MATDSQCWLRGMKLLNAAREAMNGGLSKVKFSAATAALNTGDKSDVNMLCEFVSAETLCLCHELSQLSTDSKRALLEGATHLKRKCRPDISADLDTPRSLLGLMLNTPRDSSFPRKMKSQQSMFEQASDHHCTICKSLVQRSILLRSVPTLAARITWQWCEDTGIFITDVSTSLAALLLFMESVMACGNGQEHKWALYNVLCRVDADVAVHMFATVDPAKYCSDAKGRRQYDMW